MYDTVYIPTYCALYEHFVYESVSYHTTYM